MRFQKVMLVCSIVIGLLAMLWLLLCYLMEEHVPHVLPARDEGYSFDYVVVGAGSAGAVLAALLANYSNGTVLLIEAGDKFGFLSKIPLLTTFQQKGLNDWAYLSVPQRYSSKGLEHQRQALPRGKGLGGSAQLNYMLHFAGQERDFDFWSTELNLSEWQWGAVRPFLQAGSPKPHELLEIQPHYSKVAAALKQAEAEFLHKPWLFRRARYNIKKGLRHSVLHRFLQPALQERQNLRLLTNSLAKKIQLQRAPNGQLQIESLLVGVKDEDSRKERVFSVEASRELIICAGAYQTPQLLLVSGIGAAQQLQQLQIPVQHELPQVGKQLHDHLNLPLYVSIGVVGPTLNQRALLDPLSLLNYLLTGGGHLGNFGVLGHVDSADNATAFGLTFFGAGAIDETALMSISNFKREYFRALFPRYANVTQEGFVAISSCFQPKSRGSVTISSGNVRKNPLIDPNYLAEAADVACTIRAVRAIVELITSDAFSDLSPRIHWPQLKECGNFGPFKRDFELNAPSDRYLECVMRHIGLSSHHPGGSCSMGTAPQHSVVDQQFRVHGVRNLRLVDASVLPTPISGNPNSIIVGMAVRAATMLLQEELKQKKRKENADGI